MAKFKDDKDVDKTTEENEEALKNLEIEIKLRDANTKEECILEDSTAEALRFKERKNKVFVRIKGGNGIVVSIPEKSLPDFIKIETKEETIW